MQGIHVLDIAIIGIYFTLVVAIAAYFTKKAGTSTDNFFLSGRNLPWWLAGTAMVATTFAADTPLAVTELVARNGIAGNWLWWNLAIGGMLTVFFFAKLWRRAEIVTDVEFTEMRYSGKPAAALRGFRALYLGIFMNGIVLAWVHKAMEKIFHVTVPGIDPFLLTAIVAVIIGIYAAASGRVILVRHYGSYGKYYYGTFTSNVYCGNSIFGDPNYGMVKSCSYGGVIPAGGTIGTPVKYKFTKTLVYGNSGKDVIELQQLLTALGFYKDKIDGKFLTSTVTAVKQYQKSQGIKQTGNIGPLTMAALNK